MSPNNGHPRYVLFLSQKRRHASLFVPNLNVMLPNQQFIRKEHDAEVWHKRCLLSSNKGCLLLPLQLFASFDPLTMASIVTPEEIRVLGLTQVGFDIQRQLSVNAKKNMERFHSHYGHSPMVFARAWNDLQTTTIAAARIDPANEGITISNFLYSILYLKIYPTEEQMSGRWGYCEKTVRKWAWFFIKKIAALKGLKIVWRNDFPTTFILSVDGVHCRYKEEKHDTLSKDYKLYSHKYNGPGLAYEIALDLFSNQVVWVSGPFKAGTSDKQIYKRALHDRIPEGKLVIADGGYRNSAHKELATPNALDPEPLRTFKARARMRQEAFHARVKKFDCLNVPFRHSAEHHKSCFFAACVLAQYDIELGTPLFDV